jgi:hypothetical protein
MSLKHIDMAAAWTVRNGMCSQKVCKLPYNEPRHNEGVVVMMQELKPSVGSLSKREREKSQTRSKPASILVLV